MVHSPQAAHTHREGGPAVVVPLAVLEAITRRDNSIATAVEVRQWAYEMLAVAKRNAA